MPRRNRLKEERKRRLFPTPGQVRRIESASFEHLGRRVVRVPVVDDPCRCPFCEAAGLWVCLCGGRNSISSSTCRRCGSRVLPAS